MRSIISILLFFVILFSCSNKENQSKTNIQTNSNDTRTKLYEASVEMNRGNTERVKEFAKNTELLDALNPSVYVTMAHILHKETNYSQALKTLEKALEIKPFDVNIYEDYFTSAYGFYKSTDNDSALIVLKQKMNSLDNSQIKQNKDFIKLREKLEKELMKAQNSN